MRVALSLALLALLAPVAIAEEECQPTTSDPEVDTGNVSHTGVDLSAYTLGRWYVDSDHERCFPFGSECTYSVWIAPESNGRDGYQRGDEMRDDTCGGQYESDTWLP